jgi:hypothetical protein
MARAMGEVRGVKRMKEVIYLLLTAFSFEGRQELSNEKQSK